MSDALLDLPRSDWSDWLSGRVSRLLAEVDERLGRLRRGDAGTGTGAGTRTAPVLEAWNDADLALRDAAAATSLLAEVHPDADVRTLAEDLGREVDRVRTERGLDPDLYAAVQAVDARGLDELTRRMHEHVLRDFRRSGVDRPDDARARLHAIAERLTVLEQDFARRIRDDVRSVRLRPEQLAGLPEDWVAAHPADDAGLVTVTTDYPDYMPFRAFARDGDARRELVVAFLTRAWPDNDATLHEMLALRDEQARILGYAGWPDFDADVKMIATSGAIAEFVERLADAAAGAAARDRAVLIERQRRDRPDATTFDSSDLGYYQEQVRRESFAVDAQQVRRYFAFDRVRAGLLEVTGRLFGVEYRPVDAPSWHPDVVSHDVLLDGRPVGRIHLDLHPREGKYKHAAQFDLTVGIAGRQQPEGVLVCNFPRGLMEHSDVVTLFHEFGHLLHHVLGGHQHWARFSGVATEWDFVEAPSQMLEEWAWDAGVLQTFAADEDGTPIPTDLVARMRAARDFGKGLFVRTQLYYTAVSYVLHRDRPADFTPVLRELQHRYDVVDPLEGTHFEASFGHLAGYTSAYYTYLWSLVIAKDLFSAFDGGDLFAPEVARRYRDRVLVPGGSRDAADLVADFLGRPSGFHAFAAWLDRAPQVTR